MGRIATLYAFSHAAPGPGYQAPKEIVAEERSQFVPGYSRAPYKVPAGVATAGVSTVAPQAYCHSPPPMAMTRAKPVMGPLNGSVRDRLRDGCDAAPGPNYVSSGSQHDPDSAGLADMVCGIMDEDYDEQEEEKSHEIGNCGRFRCNCLNGTGEPCSEAEDGGSNSIVSELKEVLGDLVINGYYPVESLLHKEAVRALQMFEGSKIGAEYYQGYNSQKENGDEVIQKSCLRRYVMKHFRELGYNAGICKSTWEQAGRFPAGDYEYIDVIVDEKEHFVVDIDFRAEFEIARPTVQYDALVRILPEIFVGKAERLKMVIDIMCDSARRSFQVKGMHLPPWRKSRYMHGKWLGPYKRTTNVVPTGKGCSLNECLRRELGNIALRVSGWDRGFKQRMELHYEETMSQAYKPKMKSNVPKLERIGLEWMPPAVKQRHFSGGRDGNVSGLACALKEAGLSS